MNHAKRLEMALICIAALLLSSCTDDQDPELGAESSTMRSWDACEVFDDFNTLRENFEITEGRTSTGEFISKAWSEGADPHALSCSGQFR